MRALTTFLLVGNWFFGGFVLMMLWAWFITPTFGAAVLTYAQSLGLMIVLAFVRPKPQPRNQEKVSNEINLAYAWAITLVYLMMLGIGVIVQLFV